MKWNQILFQAKKKYLKLEIFLWLRYGEQNMIEISFKNLLVFLFRI